ncbi:Cu+-exporting ATPase [Arcanobacterium wilhelmae]|uniref:Cu+-exporting ATPase n=1 Tax=Arcanobacterium wilhelmae TaxID=1803177 RepID=A0ABT9NBJ6_9ACTO|nr:cation-translocating P-type ATPase [Arcanobacterium wilhelmae]MDP9801070.1 Cu+-exporting ATPase [Arcanobacterium wilhelmae]WFN90426.1 cation-translocating P-type ATPase [Arcanobacterium wilhelmae]
MSEKDLDTIVAEVDLAVTGMTCASCANRVERKLKKVPGVSAVVNLATERAHVTLSPQAAGISDADLVAVVEKAGYGASAIRRVEVGGDGTRSAVNTGVDPDVVEAAAAAAARARVADLWRRFVISAVLSVPIIAISMVEALQFPTWQYVVGALALVVAFWCGWPFHRAAFRAGRYGSTTMDTLVSLGVIASMGWSAWAMIAGGAGALDYRMSMSGIHGLGHAASHVYFETAAMIVTFLLLGRWLEAKSRRSAGDALRSLLEMGAKSAYLIQRADGTHTDVVVPADSLQVGDIVRVRPGETVPVDGMVVSGESAIDASLVTGESLPVNVGVGAGVIGGTLNTLGSLDVQATRVGEETTLAQMGRLLTEAQTGKAPVQRLADRISAVFVPAVISLAVLVFLIRLVFVGNGVEGALTSAITILVVACPCALGLATPTALLVGSGTLSRSGILISGAEVLERAHGIDVIVLDKTGTITTGRMSVSAVDAAPEHTTVEVLTLAASAEAHSEHPIARAIVAKAHDDGLEVRELNNFYAIPGRGVSGRIDDRTVRAGTRAWLESEGVKVTDSVHAQDGASAVFVARGQELIGVISVSDMIRPDAGATVRSLAGHGISIHLATGDQPAAAARVAQAVGIANVHAGVLPAQKLEIVNELIAAGQRVAMVGDGVNDAAALAAADLSIAMGSGTDVAKATADMTIVNSEISSLSTALRVASRTLAVIKQNLAWAFGYNIIAIPLAAFGVIAPGLAAAAMASSSVIVVLNSLRLRRA